MIEIAISTYVQCVIEKMLLMINSNLNFASVKIYSRSDQGTASYYPHQGHQLQDTVQRSHQDVYPHQQFQQQPLIKKKRKTFSFALPFISLRFKKFGIEFSEYN